MHYDLRNIDSRTVSGAGGLCPSPDPVTNVLLKSWIAPVTPIEKFLKVISRVKELDHKRDLFIGNLFTT